MQKSSLLTILTLACLSAGAAPIYNCGNGSYSSKPGPGCQRADLPAIGRYTSAPRPRPAPQPTLAAAPAQTRATSGGQQAAVYRAPAPAAPVAATPSGRTNSGRRLILEQELANERRALADAQKALTESRTLPKGDQAAYAAHQARVSSLQSDVLDRQQNIQALQRELSRM
ncbi:hypothetical protein H9Q10_03530 [Eikenella sp. S3360]|uniref:DUF4124 domain-containing protein n=1 Tax=Eikenella glucosivorans TaxID=2766967 RepID=A0ABS0N8U8_9NEIS|nr:hypothetical protein [Eikenella glucosivorans]MBH5328737.1 hypothetical protein [Eikenella glucosivorans]